MNDLATESRAERWEQRAEWPLTVLAVVFLGAYAWPILDPGLPSWALLLCRVTTAVVWIAFVVDYVVRLLLSQDRRAFARGHLLDLAVIVLPLLRPLRLLRLVRVLAVLNRHASGSLRGRVVVYLVGATSLLIFVAALAILDAERGAEGSNIGSFGDALWWAFATVTTVGYGDRFPVTVGGRGVAVGLMLAGIALIGVVTATFASWLIERVAEVEEEGQQATRRDVAVLSRQIEELRSELARRPGR